MNLQNAQTPLHGFHYFYLEKRYVTMACSSFNTKKMEHRNYHKVAREELKYQPNSHDVAKRAAEELGARVCFAKKYYRGRYDQRHLKFMEELYGPVKKNTGALITMSLDTLASLSKAGIR